MLVIPPKTVPKTRGFVFGFVDGLVSASNAVDTSISIALLPDGDLFLCLWTPNIFFMPRENLIAEVSPVSRHDRG